MKENIFIKNDMQTIIIKININNIIDLFYKVPFRIHLFFYNNIKLLILIIKKKFDNHYYLPKMFNYKNILIDNIFNLLSKNKKNINKSWLISYYNNLKKNISYIIIKVILMIFFVYNI